MRDTILQMVRERKALIASGEYDEYVGRNARICDFISFVESYIDGLTVPVHIGDEFRQRLLKFRQTAHVDNSRRGEELWDLDHALHAYCADHFQTIATPQ